MGCCRCHITREIIRKVYNPWHFRIREMRGEHIERLEPLVMDRLIAYYRSRQLQIKVNKPLQLLVYMIRCIEHHFTRRVLLCRHIAVEILIMP